GVAPCYATLSLEIITSLIGTDPTLRSAIRSRGIKRFFECAQVVTFTRQLPPMRCRLPRMCTQGVPTGRARTFRAGKKIGTTDCRRTDDFHISTRVAITKTMATFSMGIEATESTKRDDKRAAAFGALRIAE